MRLAGEQDVLPLTGEDIDVKYVAERGGNEKVAFVDGGQRQLLGHVIEIGREGRAHRARRSDGPILEHEAGYDTAFVTAEVCRSLESHPGLARIVGELGVVAWVQAGTRGRLLRLEGLADRAEGRQDVERGDCRLFVEQQRVDHLDVDQPEFALHVDKRRLRVQRVDDVAEVVVVFVRAAALGVGAGGRVAGRGLQGRLLAGEGAGLGDDDVATDIDAADLQHRRVRAFRHGDQVGENDAPAVGEEQDEVVAVDHHLGLGGVEVDDVALAGLHRHLDRLTGRRAVHHGLGLRSGVARCALDLRLLPGVRLGDLHLIVLGPPVVGSRGVERDVGGVGHLGISLKRKRPCHRDP